MAIEVSSASLPQEVQKVIGIEESTKTLRDDCSSILGIHGVLEESKGLGRIFKRMNPHNLPFFVGSPKVTERLDKRMYRGKIDVKGRADSIEIVIVSLGKAPAENAEHLLIYSAELNENYYLDIGERDPSFRFRDFERDGKIEGVILGSLARKIVMMQDLKNYSDMVDIVKKSLPHRPRR